MTDLVTRLRALADACRNCTAYRVTLYNTLDEAADALATMRADAVRSVNKVLAEKDQLEAKLAEAEKVINQDGWCKTEALDHWVARAEKAEAEAAALREALRIAKSRTNRSDWAFDIDEALSQPGPGAALLHKFAIAKLALERIARGGMTVVAVDALAALEGKP